MDVGTIKTRAWQRLDDTDPGTFYGATSVLDSINKGQRLYALLSLCLERTKNFTVSASTTFYTPRSVSGFSDWLFPLRITSGGTRVKPFKLHELDALDSQWITRTHTGGKALRYCSLGFDFLAVTPTPSSGTETLSVTYCAEPAALTVDGNTPEIPEEDHPYLVDFVIYHQSLQEGGGEFQSRLSYLERFLEGVVKRRTLTRNRAIAQSYDYVPSELKLNDLSRLFTIKLEREKRIKAA